MLEVRKLFFRLFLISGLFFCPMLIASQQMSVRYSKEPLLEESRGRYENIPNYIPGQLIIKYKESTPDVEGTLDALEQSYGLGSRRKLFVLPPRKKVFPHRAKRKPQNFKKPNLENIYIINCADDVDVEALAKELMEDPQVEYAHPNYLLTVLETIPNDTYFHEQWALKNTGQTGGTPGADIKASYVWDIQKGDPNILVGILDTGVDYTHPDLAVNIWINPGEDHEPFGVIGPEDFNGVDDDLNGYVDDIHGWDFVTEDYTGPFWPRLYPGEDGGPPDNDPMDTIGHGTNCSGVLAETNNQIGISGIAWHCKIVPLRAGFRIQMELGGKPYFGIALVDAATALYYSANNNIDVISMSFGGPDNPDVPEFQLMKDAIDYAYAEGCVLVGGAMNYFYGHYRLVPSGWDNVIAVAATDHNDQRSVWNDWGVPERDRASNYSSWVDVSAPGSDIYATEVGGGYMPDFGGTSAATSHAAATAAMILSEEPNLSNEDVMWIMRCSADDIIEMGKDVFSGYGRINVLEALNYSTSTVLKAKIDSPQVWSYISHANDLPVTGYAAGEDFNNYALAYGAGKDPNSWMVLAESNLPVEDGILGYWDTNSLQRNFYTLKLSVTDSNDEDFEYRHTVLHNPDFAPGWPVGVEGCMFHSSLTLADIDADNDIEILGSPYVRQQYRESLGRFAGPTEVFAFHHDASVVSGWPKEHGGYVYEGTPAIADIDGDGDLEIVVAVSTYGKVYVWHANGGSVTGWPQYVTDAGFLGAATIYDLDGIPDNGLEVIAAATNEDDDYGKVYAWHADGTLVSGWPQNCHETWGTPAIADVDADGKGEIFIGAYDNKMYAFNDDGSVLAGQWPITVGGQIFSSTAIADLDSDGEYEIVVGAMDCNVYAWEVNGTDLIGWPKSTGCKVWSSPSIADIDGDGGLDVVIGSEDCNVYAWHGDGTPIAGWPVNTGGAVKSSAAIGDIDGDGQVEVVIGSFDKNIYAFNGDGSIVPDWPILTTGTTFCTVAITDVDDDGDVDLAFGSNDFKIYVIDINAPYDPNKIPWPMAHHDMQNTGCYPIHRPLVLKTTPDKWAYECNVRQIEVIFTKPVANVSADDLTISIGEVLSVTGDNEGPYIFDVIITQPGLVTAVLDGDITDLDGIKMAACRWTFTQTTIPPDLNCDGLVNLYDIAIIGLYWLDIDCNRLDLCSIADFDYSTIIDLSDLGVFVEDWLYNWWGSEYGLSFDGDDRVIIDNNQRLITSKITVESWVNFSRLAFGPGFSGTDAQFIICKGGDTTTGAYRLIQGGSDPNAHYLSFCIGRFGVAVSDITLEINRWYHIAGIYDGQTMKLYLDGSLVASGDYNAYVGNTSPLYFSYNDVGGYPYHLTGQIDEVRIWNYARTAEQLVSNMNRFLTGQETGLVGYWPLNEGSGQSIFDTTSGGSNGRLGSTWDVEADDPTWVPSTVPFQLGP